MESSLKAWLVAVLEGLVSHPEAIEVTETTDEMGLLFSVKVHDEDIGKVIGKNGKIADAIRTLLRSCGQKDGQKASMKVDAGKKA